METLTRIRLAIWCAIGLLLWALLIPIAIGLDRLRTWIRR